MDKHQDDCVRVFRDFSVILVALVVIAISGRYLYERHLLAPTDEPNVFSEEETSTTIRGVLRHGRSGAAFLNSQPEFSIQDIQRNWHTPTLNYDPVSGKFQATGLSSNLYRVYVTVDENLDNPFGYPGDYRGWVEADTRHGDAGATIDLKRIIRVFEPLDNLQLATRLPDHCANVRAVSPVRLRWEPVHADARYRYRVIARECGNPRNYRSVSDGISTTTDKLFPLPPNKENWYYAFQIHAQVDEIAVGEVQINGASWNAGEIKVLVED